MADKEPKDLIGRIHGFLGMKPSKEGLEEAERIRRAGEANVVAIKKAGEADLARIKAGIDAYGRDVQQRRDALDEESAHMSKEVGHATDVSFDASGRPNIEQMRFIHQWNDGYGNIVYSVSARGKTDLVLSQVRPLSMRIQTQQSAFSGLGADEQSRIRGEFDVSKGSVASSYRDFLQNEALGKRFAEIKTNPPRPSFGPK